MTTEEDKKKIDWLKFLNTMIISIILCISILIFSSINHIKDTQEEVGKELVRISTVQDNNTAGVASLIARVTAIELNQKENIQNWVELNFIRKK